MSVFLALSLLLAQNPAEAAYDAALTKLESGDAAGAETSAREALAQSLRFVPEEEIEERPDKGILFEEMILAARQEYRERRARYFRALGDALAAQEKWRASRKAYSRAAGMAANAELSLTMADDPDLEVPERVEFLLDAYLTPGSDRARIEELLLASGSFRSRNALKAALDERRFPELQSELPDLELLSDAFPRFQAVTDDGTLNTAELYRQGSLLLVYIPVEVCAHCSEQLDGITVPVLEARRGGKSLTVAAFVPEGELPIARRIVRLLAMDVSVGRIDGLPQSLEFATDGELRVVARGGITQIVVPMSADLRAGEIRQRLEAIFAFLDAPGLPTEDEPEEASIELVRLEQNVNQIRMLYDWIDTVAKLEAGHAPLDDLYEKLRQQTQHVARESGGRELGFEIMAALGKLRGARSAKMRAFDLLGAEPGDRLLAEVQRIDPEVRSAAPASEGVFFVSVDAPESGPRRVILQRTFQTSDALRHFNVITEDDGEDLAIVWVAPEPEEPRGVDVVAEGAVFRFTSGPDCDGVRLVREEAVAYESCYGDVIDGELVEVRSALVDRVPNGPRYFERDVISGAPPGALENALQLFERGDMRGAAAGFEAARESIDPVAPYDASDLIYNRARALEELGQRQEALALYRSLGDVSYQSLVDDGAGRIEGAPR